MPVQAEPNYYFPYFGSDVGRKYIEVEITYLNGKKERGWVVGENIEQLWIITKRKKIEIRFKKLFAGVTILRIRNPLPGSRGWLRE